MNGDSGLLPTPGSCSRWVQSHLGQRGATPQRDTPAFASGIGPILTVAVLLVGGIKIPRKQWNWLFNWLPSTSDACTAAQCEVPLNGLIFYGLAAFAVFLIILVLLFGRSGDDGLEDTIDDDQPDGPLIEGADEGDNDGGNESDGDDDDDDWDIPEDEIPDDVGSDTIDELFKETVTRHKETVAPPPIRRAYSYLKAGSVYRQTFYVAHWPDQLQDGIFGQMFRRPDLNFDASFHFEPIDRQRAISDAEDRVESLQADASITSEQQAGGGEQFRVGDTMEKANRTSDFRNVLNDGAEPFYVSGYFSVTADTKDDLETKSDQLVSEAQDTANVQLEPVHGMQVRALEATAPIAYNQLKYEAPMDVRRIVTDAGVGSILSSANESKLMEDSGVLLGTHTYNGTPVIKDTFESETNYNWVVIGDSGAGKSYSQKAWNLRDKAASEDTMLIIVDPMSGFDGIASALGGTRIEVGGSKGLNPLEIRQPEGRMAAEATSGDDPLSTKIKEVMGYLEAYANEQGTPLGDRRPVLNSAVKQAYAEKGITRDVNTHDEESPTMTDVFDILQDMQNSPEDYRVFELPSDADDSKRQEMLDHIRGSASWLLKIFRPWVDGQYENLTRETEFDLRDDDVYYLDLKQQESTNTSGGSLMLQILFSLVYERAKEVPDNVIMVIDEAHYLMSDETSMDYLKTRVRHARHYDMSLRFLTQEVSDFFGGMDDGGSQSQPILNNTFIKVFLRTDEVAEYQDHFDLNDRMVRFIENARTGKSGKYSQALMTINKQPFPINIRTTQTEHAVVDFDRVEDEISDLPGRDAARDSELVQNIREELLRLKYNQLTGTSSIQDTDALSDWASGDVGKLAALDVLSDDEIYRILEEIEEGAPAEEAVYRSISQKLLTTLSQLPQSLRSGIVNFEEQRLAEQQASDQAEDNGEDREVGDDPDSWALADPLDDSDQSE
ncbi:hypothetical protein SAMN05216388_10813 [Halorientalis persicus]|uniref:Type IV secretory pathway, VirB4 component n=1 Tax=Halorientalis persicus TaxID=1367881 RepID=A0A1H8WVC7_9EURY|nr:hypothetical protein SAMN05216388_10813 [Halorientalis persicus]